MNSSLRHPLISLFCLTASVSYGQLYFVNGASLLPGQPFAPGSIAAVFGDNLCEQTAAGDWGGRNSLPFVLGGCSLTVAGNPAQLQYVSPGQINFIVPRSTPPGTCDVLLHNGARVFNGSLLAGPAGPGVFALNGLGMGEGAMLHGTLWSLPPFSVTTDGATTPVAIYLTGLDLSTKPAVTIGGIAVEITWWGEVPGYPGLQQININLPPALAGVGRVPAVVTSAGQAGNVTYITILPTAEMMNGAPGWGPGMVLRENMPRSHEMASLAFNAANNTAIVSDENDDAVRIISLASASTVATVTLPAQSIAGGVAVDSQGRYAAVALTARASIALIDLASNQVAAVIGTGYYPTHVAFSGSALLVTNGASATVSVIDVPSRIVTRTVDVGLGPSGIAVWGNTAVVANIQAGSLSLIDLTSFSSSTVALPAGSKPHEVAISAAGVAVITNPLQNAVLLFNLANRTIGSIDLGATNAKGAAAVATNGNFAYVTDQTTASVSAIDLNAGQVVKTFAVDPGPRSLAVDSARNRLLVLAQGTGTLDVVDLASYTIITRIDAGAGERQGAWALPSILSVTPATAGVGSTFTLTLAGSNLEGIQGIQFHYANGSAGTMGSGMGMGYQDQNIQVSNLQVNEAGTQVRATIRITPDATVGARQLRLETSWGEVMSPGFRSLFTVTAP
ncbi:MAG: hypothetical protein KGN84_22345 [Acidobacteriota bacterium]|nr:hypothetical protein [Acidobacteriota bacterium]